VDRTLPTSAKRGQRRALMFVVSLLLLAVFWELYKTVGPQAGGKVFGASLLPKAENRSMPHVWDMLGRLGRSEQRGSDRSIFMVVLSGMWFTLRIALAGLVLGLAVGMGLAVLMARFKLLERALVPWLIISQTVPLIALAPLVVSWGGRLHIGSFTWQKWMSAAVIGAFLAFFPISIGALRGLSSPPPAAVELMDSYAASWRSSLTKVRLPAALPYLVPALKLGANAAVVGAIVAELSTGLKGGIGRLIIEYMRESTGDPAKVFTAVFGAAALGLTMAGLIALIDISVSRNRPKELAA
jgi:NitT/TauT family transport system permease protein